MIKNKIQLFFGITLAPIFILFALPLLNCLYPIFKIELTCLQSIGSFALYGIPVVIIAVIISLPLIFLFIKKKWTGMFHFGLGGILVSLFISGLMILFGEGTNTLGVILVMVSMGTTAALLFWYIGIKNNISNE